MSELSIVQWLQEAIARHASDLHIGDGICPTMRVDGDLVILNERPFAVGDTFKVLKEYLSEDRVHEFAREKELDYSFGVPGLGRFRVNLYYQRSNICAAIRALPMDPMSFDDIGFPQYVAEMLVN